MTDRELLSQIAKKNTDSFEKLMDRYSSYAAKIVTMVGGSFLTVQDVEELTADVFVRLWQNADRMEVKGDSIKGYLAAMARNRAKTALHSKNIDVLPLEEDILSIEADTEEQVVLSETRRAVSEAVSDMEELDREIFIRRYFYFQKIADIAKQLSMNKKTVETKLIRGREKLKKTFIERGVTV